MYYKSPEMLLDFGKSEPSTDMWSLGCVFAALLYRRSIFFVGADNHDQLMKIASVSRTLSSFKPYQLEGLISLLFLHNRAPLGARHAGSAGLQRQVRHELQR